MKSSQLAAPRSASGRHGGHGPVTRVALWTIATVALILIGLFVTSFFLDNLLRPRLEARMNSSLKGYRVTLGHAHLQLLNLRLTLNGLIIVQEAHSNPPVAEFPLIRFHVHWRELLSDHVVAAVGIWNPRIHINQPQLVTEARSKTPVRQQGWQDALEAVYPFKINRLAIHDGDVTYIDKPDERPLHLTDLNFVTDNIRNIHEPNNVYPSSFSGRMMIFGSGRLRVDGRANYLMKPYPGVTANYFIKQVPLSAVTPASQHVNMIITAGSLSSDGSIEYSPRITNLKVRNVSIGSASLTYVHLAQTQGAEKERITKVGKTIQKENNRSAVNIEVQELDVRNSRLCFKDQDSDPPYVLFVSDTDMTVRNFSNRAEHGIAQLDLTGKFMGSGTTHVYGTFAASGQGPQFTTNVEIVNTDLIALNPLMRAHGRIDVAQGHLTVYAQIGVQNSRITGYVKPMFSDVEVYSSEKDKNNSALQQAKDLVVGAAAHMLKNGETQKVATQVSLAGNLNNPDVSTWEALVEVVRNAFIQAILPGFDRQVNPQGIGQPQSG